MKLSIIIPYRDNGQEDRYHIAQWCFKRYKYLFPNAEIILSDSKKTIFSRGESINLGVSKSTGDYIIITDSDYLFSDRMAKEIVNRSPWTIACKTKNYYFTNNIAAYEILQLPYDIKLEKINFGNNIQVSQFEGYGQVIAMPKINFVGFDETMKGYGWEDNQFYYCMRACHGSERRTNNKMYHLYHERLANTPYMQHSYNNRDYYEATWQPIESNRRAIRELMKQKGMYFR